MEYYIYVLFDPRNGMPFYVGMTKQPEKRLYEHLANSRSNPETTNRNYQHIRSILADGLKPHMEVVEKTPTEADARGREVFWMGLMVYYGIPIVNPAGYWVRANLLGFIAYHDQYQHEIVKRFDLKAYVSPKWVDSRIKKAVHHAFRERHGIDDPSAMESVIYDHSKYIEYLEQTIMRYEKGA